MLTKDFDEMIDRVKAEFVKNGFKEDNTNDHRIVLTKGDNTVVVSNVSRAVQIFVTFAHDWSLDVFPRLSAVTVCGNSIFYYGRIKDNE